VPDYWWFGDGMEDSRLRWRLRVSLPDLAAPIQAYLRWLDRDGRRQIWVRPDRIDDWPDDLVPPDQPSS
jgi:hypothetical protein